jgi:hypothetical protein
LSHSASRWSVLMVTLKIHFLTSGIDSTYCFRLSPSFDSFTDFNFWQSASKKYISFSFLFFFFLQYWGLNTGPCTC